MNQDITVLQSIETSWTKQSRGAPGAIHRNAIPEALRIPLEQHCLDGCTLIEHLLGFDEWHSFADPQPSIRVASFESGDEIRHRCVLVQKIDKGLRVNWKYTPEDAGIPLRSPKRSDIFELSQNQWGQVIYNGRFNEWEGGWWYRKTVLNVGLFEKPHASVFIETSPNVIINKMADLY